MERRRRYPRRERTRALFLLLFAAAAVFLSVGSQFSARLRTWAQEWAAEQGTLKSAGVSSLRALEGELVPALCYDEGEDGGGILLSLIGTAVQKEMVPLQQYVVDYWNGGSEVATRYSDAVPDYFKEADDTDEEVKKKEAGAMEAAGEGQTYSLSELSDYDFLLSHFYIVDETTYMTEEDLQGEKLVKKDLSAAGEDGEPLVLIYHTHGSEEYKKSGGKAGTVVEVGEALKEALENRGIAALHDQGIYDMVNGELDRNAAYNYAGDSVEKTLEKYPSIKVVIDLHRDSVDESIHLTTEVDGKKTAQIMFFNGVSRLSATGEIGYLENPNKSANLAFSLQMQLLAAKYYPDFTRKIYIKGYRYNLHLLKRATLIEVGAQNNTVEEAKNAMTPLADILCRLLGGEKCYGTNE